eukprot:CAMPEP_0168361628 /NCGR_PEP_ID=MMETSP0228-20121227/2763_1 /TAXON_ID=133427 /ORGANISM="Protoceratium reticulatum, Strain CCCM 535 (=CCMP 1889)" /LENGTH=225 /DNA_ID=CAMNT_0008374309 /DNA_START=517 /DNA_END=1192 /DNA_ORIENTATION=+
MTPSFILSLPTLRVGLRRLNTFSTGIKLRPIGESLTTTVSRQAAHLLLVHAPLAVSDNAHEEALRNADLRGRPSQGNLAPVGMPLHARPRELRQQLLICCCHEVPCNGWGHGHLMDMALLAQIDKSSGVVLGFMATSAKVDDGSMFSGLGPRRWNQRPVSSPADAARAGSEPRPAASRSVATTPRGRLVWASSSSLPESPVLLAWPCRARLSFPMAACQTSHAAL